VYQKISNTVGCDACCDGEEKYACRTLNSCPSQASRNSEGSPAQRMSETHSMRRKRNKRNPDWKRRNNTLTVCR